MFKGRATQYLARIYDRILKGKSYLNSPMAIHVGFLDYNLFEDEQEFYSRYLMENVRSHRVFNDRFDMRVIRMNLADFATEEDKKYKIDEWVRLFKAKTWEPITFLEAKRKEINGQPTSRSRVDCEKEEKVGQTWTMIYRGGTKNDSYHT